MCFRDVCFNAKNFTELKQPALAIHLLQMLLASSAPPISAGGDETHECKTEALSVRLQSLLSVGTAGIPPGFAGLWAPPSREAGQVSSLGLEESLLQPILRLVFMPPHRLHADPFPHPARPRAGQCYVQESLHQVILCDASLIKPLLSAFGQKHIPTDI